MSAEAWRAMFVAALARYGWARAYRGTARRAEEWAIMRREHVCMVSERRCVAMLLDLWPLVTS